MRIRVHEAAFVVGILALSGCGDQPKVAQLSPSANIDSSKFPEFGAAQEMRPGITFREVELASETGYRGPPMRVWYYRPTKADGKLPLVLVPPAGSNLFNGMAMGEGDRAEHFPYVEAGFAVASFDIDGVVKDADKATDNDYFAAGRAFRNSKAGLANICATLDFITAKAPEVDPNRIYVVGHSSAATLALLAAEQEPRIKACVAFAAPTDVSASLSDAIPQLDRAIPGFRDFLRDSSPSTHAEKLKCPLFLFHAQDDTTVPIRQALTFAEKVKKSNPNVTVVKVAKGGHYDSMIREGMPKAVAWLKTQDGNSR